MAGRGPPALDFEDLETPFTGFQSARLGIDGIGTEGLKVVGMVCALGVLEEARSPGPDLVATILKVFLFKASFSFNESNFFIGAWSRLSGDGDPTFTGTAAFLRGRPRCL